jgi:hypothetical protein
MSTYDNWKTTDPNEDQEPCSVCGAWAKLKSNLCADCFESLDPRNERMDDEMFDEEGW